MLRKKLNHGGERLVHWKPLKEIKEDTNKRKDIPHAWIKDLIMLRCRYYLKRSADPMQCHQNLNDLFLQK